MENITTKLKALISLIEKGNVKIDSLNEINSFLDALLDVNENLQSENKDKKLKTFECIYCGIKTTNGNLQRWHNDKCKNKSLTDLGFTTA